MRDIVGRLKAGIRQIGLADDNNTELFDIEEANEAMFEAAAEITRLQAELAEARESKGRIMIATAASVKASMDEYKRGHADGVKSGQEKGLDEAATELERLDGFGEWWDAAQAIRALKSPKPPIL